MKASIDKVGHLWVERGAEYHTECKCYHDDTRNCGDYCAFFYELNLADIDGTPVVELYCNGGQYYPQYEIVEDERGEA